MQLLLHDVDLLRDSQFAAFLERVDCSNVFIKFTIMLRCFDRLDEGMAGRTHLCLHLEILDVILMWLSSGLLELNGNFDPLRLDTILFIFRSDHLYSDEIIVDFPITHPVALNVELQ